jgi:hypothetical protein
MGRWKEGLMFQGINPTPGLGSAANWFPPTEEDEPGELRITFMGSAPFLRPGQMNTSIFIELGNGDNFVFDIGEGVGGELHLGRAGAEPARQDLHHAPAPAPPARRAAGTGSCPRGAREPMLWPP